MKKYERSLNHNYIIFEEEDEEYDALAVPMLKENTLKGLLPPEISKNNVRIRFAYEISGYQCMNALVGKTPINCEQMTTLFNTIYELSEELESYLLEADHIVLDPSCICWSREADKVFFCYDPFTRFDIKSCLKDLIGQILRNIDMNDINAVRASYALFRAVNEDRFCLKDLIAKLQEYDSAYTFDAEKLVVADEQFTGCDTEENFSDRKAIGKIEEQSEIAQPASKGLSKLFEDEEDDWEKEVTQGRLFKTSKKKKGKKKQEKQERFILSAASAGIDPIEVNTFPFLIGSIPYAADACINDASISRFHARFDQSGEKIYLSDLGSADGTFLNDTRLNRNVQKEIAMGDRIRFGNLAFSVSKNM